MLGWSQMYVSYDRSACPVDAHEATYLVTNLFPQKRRILPLPYYDADGRVLDFLVLVRIDEFDLDERIDWATPGLLAVHARAFLLIILRLRFVSQ